MILDSGASAVHRHGTTLVVMVPEPMVATEVMALREAVFAAIQAGGLRRMVLDFAATDSVDTAALKALERLIEGAQLLGQEVMVVGLRPHVAATITELGDFFQTVSAACSLHSALQAGPDRPGKSGSLV